MECSNIQEKLSAYLEGILSPEEKILFDSHLKSCQKCSRSLSDLRKAIEYVRNLEEVEPPSWMTQNVMERVREESRPKRSLLQKLLYPLHIKVPIEVIATISIAITTFYVFKSIQPEMKLETRTETAKEPSASIPKRKAPSSVTARGKVPKQSEPADKSGSRSPDKDLKKQDKVIASGETSPVPAKPAEQPLPAKELEVLEARKVPQTPAPAEKQEEAMRYAGSSAKDELKREAPSPAQGLKAAMAERRMEGIILTLTVKDMDASVKEITKAVEKLEGKIIRTESFEDKIILMTEIGFDRFRELFMKLKLIGDLKEKELKIKKRDGSVELRIEITRI